MNKALLWFVIALCKGIVIWAAGFVFYGVFVIAVTKTWSGDWPIERQYLKIPLHTGIEISFVMSFCAFVAWEFLKNLEPKEKTSEAPP